MTENNWEVVEVVAGDLQAEVLRGLLEAQGIPAILSQESAGHSVFPVTVGKFGEVQILVQSDQVEEARAVLADYKSGKFSAPDGPDIDEDEPLEDEW
jgi:hypothetical protein